MAPRIDERLVALHVDDDVAVERGGDLGEAIGAGFDASPCVSRTLPPNSLTRVAMRRSSVATMTSRDDRGDATTRR